MLTLLLLLVPFANAGKLSDGWRGHPYGLAGGPGDFLSQAPTENCTPDPESGVRWRCSESIGGAPVEVNYMLATELGGVFTGVVIQCKGYLVCTTVIDTLMAAWGKPFRIDEYGQIPDRTWADGSVLAGWEYNQFSDSGTANTFDKVIYERIKAVQAAKARAAADAL